MKTRIGSVAMVGIAIGVCWVAILGATQPEHALSRGFWQVVMLISCPPVAALGRGWWWVPVLNGLLYASIALSCQFLRKFFRPFAS